MKVLNLDGIFWSKQVHYVDFRIQLIWTSLTNLTNLAIFAISANKTILCQFGQFVTNLIIFWYLDNFESFLFKISPIVGKSQTIIKNVDNFEKLNFFLQFFKFWTRFTIFYILSIFDSVEIFFIFILMFLTIFIFFEKFFVIVYNFRQIWKVFWKYFFMFLTIVESFGNSL